MKKLSAIILSCLLLCLCGCASLRAAIYSETPPGTDPEESSAAVETACTLEPEMLERISSANVYVAFADSFGLNGISCVYFDSLSGSEQQLYNLLVISLENCAGEVSVPESISADAESLKRVSDAILHDQPQLFWYDGRYEYTYSSDIVRTVTPVYNSFAGELEENVSALAETVQRIHEQAASQDADVLLCEKIFHDYICENCDYVSCTGDQTAYSALVDGRAVCAGFARAFQLLCLREGMTCYYVSGTATNSNGETDTHAWNVLALGEDFYNIDVTWDDQESIDATFYGYYNVTDEVLLKNHVRSETSSIVPACSGTQYSFSGIFGLDSSLAGVISASGCETVISSLEEYKALLRESLILGGEGETHFDFIVTADLYEEISSCVNDSEQLRDYVRAAADALGLNGFNFNTSVNSTNYGNGYIYVIESTSLYGK